MYFALPESKKNRVTRTGNISIHSICSIHFLTFTLTFKTIEDKNIGSDCAQKYRVKKKMGDTVQMSIYYFDRVIDWLIDKMRGWKQYSWLVFASC